MIFNTDDNSAGGAPGNNADDNVSLRVSIDGAALSDVVLRDQTIPYAQDLFGTTITLGADLTFYNDGLDDRIQIDGYLIDNGGTTMVSTSVLASAYTGDYFGFVTRARNRGVEPGRNAPWTMDYESFSVALGGLPCEGFALWAAGWGVEIGGTAYDFDLDGMLNLYEYGLDGDPTNALDRGTLPILTSTGGALIYVHPQRSDDSSLIYSVETTTNLLSGTWTNEGYTVEGTQVTGETLNYVTNNVDKAELEKFIRLNIDQ